MSKIFEIIKICFISLLSLLIVVLLMIIMFFYNKTFNIMSTYKKMIAVEFFCPSGAIEKRDYWGKSGFTRFCQKDNQYHGRWTAWDNGEIVIDGSYKEGYKHGKWLYFNSKIVEYRNGVEVKSYSLPSKVAPKN